MRPATIEMPVPGMPLDCESSSLCVGAGSDPPDWHVSVLIFEPSNVLYDDTAWRRWLFRLLSRMGLHTNYACFFRVWDDEYLPAVNRGEREFESSFRQFLAAVGLKPAQIQEVEIAAIPRYEQLELSARPLPGVLPTLERLSSSGMQMAVQSDCILSSSQLKAKLDGLGIGSFFSHCRTSIDMRATKSTSRCFEAVLADLELPAHDVAFVGRRHDDLAGAAACGLWTIAFNGEPDAEAEWHLPHFKDLTMLSAGPLARAA